LKRDLFSDHLTKTYQGNGKNMAVMEALVARFFNGVTTIKATYPELQRAQLPYNN